jgi:hypothetical protein
MCYRSHSQNPPPKKNWLRLPYVFMCYRSHSQNSPRCWLARSDEEELGALERQWQAGGHAPHVIGHAKNGS